MLPVAAVSRPPASSGTSATPAPQQAATQAPESASELARPEPQTEPPLPPPASAEVEMLIAALVSLFEGGQVDAFATLFDADAQFNESRGRAAIRSDYNELFMRSTSRRMNVRQLRWHSAGERTQATGEFVVRIAWRDGRELEQRLGVELDLVNRGGRTVISRMSQTVRN